jgi:hypothetical protein
MPALALEADRRWKISDERVEVRGLNGTKSVYASAASKKDVMKLQRHAV